MCWCVSACVYVCTRALVHVICMFVHHHIEAVGCNTEPQLVGNRTVQKSVCVYMRTRMCVCMRAYVCLFMSFVVIIEACNCIQSTD